MSIAREHWFIRIRGQVQGPYSPDQLRSLIRRGVFGRMHEVSQDRMTWQRASTLAELFAQSQSPPTLASSSQDASVRTAADQDAATPQLLAEPLTDIKWYITKNGEVQGPLSEADLAVWASQGVLQPGDRVWTEGMADWMPAESVGRFALYTSPAGVDGRSLRNLEVSHTGLTSQQTSSSTAVSSMVLGILGWTLLPVIGGIGAVILGHLALEEIRRSGNVAGRRGVALTGLILGYSVLVSTLTTLVIWLIVGAVNRT